MPEQEVYMDIPAVTSMAQAFGGFSDALKTVSTILQGAIDLLNATAFIGDVGGAAVAAWLNTIKPNVDNMANKMSELQSGIQGAISNYVTGDTNGSALFR
jgi:hypothetical protein